MNYQHFFNFTDEPFRLTPDQDLFFPSSTHAATADVIRFGLDQGEGFIIVSGEVGTGKSMLLRHMMRSMGDQFETALILSPELTPKELLQSILYDIGLKKEANIRFSLGNLVYKLNDYLFKLSKKGKRLLVIIDEAQNIPDKTIEQLRLLSNFESEKQKMMQIVLFGQPELRNKLEQPELRQLLQRVSIIETLIPLAKEEMVDYVHYRLEKCGRGDLRLNRHAAKTLWRYSKGNPRMINKIMNRTLLLSYAHQLQELKRKFIKQASDTVTFRRRVNHKTSMFSPAWATAVIPILIGIIWAI